MRTLVWCLLLLVPSSAWTATLPTAQPEDVGMSGERLKRVSAHLKRYIDQGDIAGAVSLVARKGRIVHFEAQGLADLDSKRPMQRDAIFQLFSMTKPVASLAAMMLLEEGRYLLDDPISNFLPEFKEMKVAVPNAPNERGARQADAGGVAVEPRAVVGGSEGRAGRAGGRAR